MTERAPYVLVVDDVAVNIRLLRTILTPRRSDVVTASDGLEN